MRALPRMYLKIRQCPAVFPAANVKRCLQGDARSNSENPRIRHGRFSVNPKGPLRHERFSLFITYYG